VAHAHFSAQFSTGIGKLPHDILHRLTFVFHQRLVATLMPSNACGGADRSTRDAPIGRQGGAEVSAKRRSRHVI
jgi:hypothetical protein